MEAIKRIHLVENINTCVVIEFYLVILFAPSGNVSLRHSTYKLLAHLKT